ncbi:MAG: hypothetical protein LUQ71_10205 [Methanoregula sp.]|nr:hypothetical protein [Methanoregula sp.]
MSEERVTRMVGRLSSAFTREPGSNIEKLIRSVESELQNIEDTGNAIRTAHQFEKATGAALDFFAAIYGVTRKAGESDASVRQKITVATQVRTACGTKADVIALIARVTGYAEDDIDLIEFESTIPTGGWGKQLWGTSPWGGSNRTAAGFRLVLYGSGVSPGFALADLIAGIDRVRAAGVLFNKSSTVIRIDPLEITVAAASSSSIVLPKVTGLGWGSQPWGSSAWGGCYVRVTPGEPTATLTS